MGLLDWFRKDKSLEKTQKYGCDPFYDYRKKNVLPEKYEYGMNCYVNRVYEQYGEEIAQKVYENLKKNPEGLTIADERYTQDVGTLTLFGVSLESIVKAEKGIIDRGVYLLDKHALIRLMVAGTNIELMGFTKTESKGVHHAVTIRSRDIILDSDQWLGKAQEFLKKKDYWHAIDYYNKAIEVEPLDARAWNNKGAALNDLKEYREAIKCFDKAIEIAPRFVLAWCNKANSLIDIKDYQEAVECYDKVIEIEPKNVDAWENKAIFLAVIKKYKEAVECCDKVIEIEPKCARAWYNKGSFLVKLENFEEAAKCINKACKMDRVIARTFKKLVKGEIP